jgi:methylmalonyl-CoA/ethylmalonyl-CoA epimerase
MFPSRAAAAAAAAAPALGRLNHVGIATPSIDRSVARYRDLLGATVVREPFDLPSQGVRVCFIDLANSQIELVEPLGPDSPVARYLERHPGGGQHHVCFEVPDILAARDHLVAGGATVLMGGEPRIGAHGVPTIFVHPRDMGGVLIELMAEPGH